MAFDLRVLSPNPVARQRYLAIMQAALEAVDPYHAVRHQLRRDAATLWVGNRSYDLGKIRKVWVVGAGKAGAPMAQAAEDVLGDALAGGLVIVKRGHMAPTRRVTLVEAGHPIPDQAGVDGGRQLLAVLAEAGAADLVLALLSGGGSALLEVPAAISLADLQATTDALLGCGATINEINCLRKHLSLVKGGQLARAAAPAQVATLVLSDVVGSPLDVIASGPTVGDPSSWADAWAVVERYALQLPAAVLARLEAGRQGLLAETPKPDDPLFSGATPCVVGDNRVAALAACRQAEALGYQTLLLSTFVEGEARTVAGLAVALAREIQASGHPCPAPACLVLGGETTVTLGAVAGQGGRNQELALAAACLLAGTHGVSVAALATDGSDGPTDSAGGLVDGTTLQRGQALGLAAKTALNNHAAYPYLQRCSDLLQTGPTHTKVNDLIFVWVEAPLADTTGPPP